MPTPRELEDKLWNALKSDMTVMLGLEGLEDGHTRPMTAQLEQERGPIWFFASKDNALVQNLPPRGRAIVTFASRNHELFASIQGTLTLDQDPMTIDRLWNPHVAAWYEGGKNDPKLALLRLDAERAEIWENASSLVAGIKTLLGADPKQDYRDKVAKVRLK